MLVWWSGRVSWCTWLNQLAVLAADQYQAGSGTVPSAIQLIPVFSLPPLVQTLSRLHLVRRLWERNSRWITVQALAALLTSSATLAAGVNTPCSLAAF
ncbi:hypothetical protein COO60DRAFT_1552599, partial [Scenedesmus sp. NREL 46B-D3]